MNRKNDSEVIFEAYASKVVNEMGYYSPASSAVLQQAYGGASAAKQQRANVAAQYPALTPKAQAQVPSVVAAGPAQRLPANVQVSNFAKSKGLAGTDEFKKLEQDTNAGIAATPTSNKIVTGSTDAANTVMNKAGIPTAAQPGRAFGKTGVPTSQAFGAAGVPLRPGVAPQNKPVPAATAAAAPAATTSTNANAGAADAFKKFHGTSYDPNSAADRKKMEHIQGLQKAGTPLTAKSVYSPAPAANAAAPATPATTSTNPPGTMLSRGLQKVGQGLGTGLRAAGEVVAAPVKGIYQGLTNSQQPATQQPKPGMLSNLKFGNRQRKSPIDMALGKIP